MRAALELQSFNAVSATTGGTLNLPVPSQKLSEVSLIQIRIILKIRSFWYYQIVMGSEEEEEPSKYDDDDDRPMTYL